MKRRVKTRCQERIGELPGHRRIQRITPMIGKVTGGERLGAMRAAADHPRSPALAACHGAHRIRCRADAPATSRYRPRISAAAAGGRAAGRRPRPAVRRRRRDGRRLRPGRDRRRRGAAARQHGIPVVLAGRPGPLRPLLADHHAAGEIPHRRRPRTPSAWTRARWPAGAGPGPASPWPASWSGAGQAAAVVSAGSTGAIVATARLRLRLAARACCGPRSRSCCPPGRPRPC